MAPKTKAGKARKIKEVLSEYKADELHSSSGAKVTSRAQAVAIALQSAGQAKRSKARKGADKRGG